LRVEKSKVPTDDRLAGCALSRIRLCCQLSHEVKECFDCPTKDIHVDKALERTVAAFLVAVGRMIEQGGNFCLLRNAAGSGMINWTASPRRQSEQPHLSDPERTQRSRFSRIRRGDVNGKQSSYGKGRPGHEADAQMAPLEAKVELVAKKALFFRLMPR
jgi:hypothetical protein